MGNSYLLFNNVQLKNTGYSIKLNEIKFQFNFAKGINYNTKSSIR